MASLTWWTCIWVGDEKESLECCSPWSHKESDMTEQLNWAELNLFTHQSLFRWEQIFFYFYFILLYNTVLVLPYIDMNPPRCTCVPKHEPPSHLPPHNISLGHSHASAPSILYPVSSIDWQFVSYMIVYMFQCHSPKSSYPLPLPQSPKVCSTHLCLFCCLAYRVIITIFLNSIYMC